MYDDKAWHFVALDQNELIGCVIIVPFNENLTHVKLIQMAVDHSHQGKGVGRKLIEEVIIFCKVHGIEEIMCHARESAISFYEKLGFITYGSPFKEVGIVHKYMRRLL